MSDPVAQSTIESTGVAGDLILAKHRRRNCARDVRLVCLRSTGSPDTPDVQEMFRLHAKATG